jgi:probable O-glycosylation ligase (exosortase A-associated)
MPPPTVRMEGTGLLYVGYVLLMGIEYLGLGNDLSILKALHVSTLLHYGLFAAVLLRAPKSELFKERQVKIYLVFFLMTCLSVFYGYVQTRALNSIEPFAMGLIMLFLTIYLVDRKSRIDGLAALFAVVAVVLLVRNLGKMGAAARASIFTASYFMGDGNDFAWGLAVMFPIVMVLVIGRRSLVTRAVGAVGMLACIMGLVGTQSRGGTLGLAAAAAYGWWYASRRKAMWAAAVPVLAVGLIIIAPSGYFDRIQTVTEYDEDNSALARLQAWGAAVEMAMYNPLGVGAGNFNSAYGRDFIPEESRVTYGGQRWLSAHSIYFKVLGEYGFIGAAMLIMLLVANIRQNRGSRRLAAEKGAHIWADDRWPELINMSVCAFAVAGAFLSGFQYPHLFILTGLSMATRRMLDATAAAAPAVQPAAAPLDRLTVQARAALFRRRVAQR